jgi:tRNA nucleotidyltransferase/poly(A) polymerase
MFNISFNFIKKLKRNFFPFYRDNELKFVFNKLQEGFPNDTITARFVGGCVRKYLTNEFIDDIDIATTLSSEDIIKKFKDTNFKIIETGIKHGTVTLLTKKFKLELTTLRKDIKTDGRHAEVEYIDDWQQDSERRDFTINAIYLDKNGKIYDPQMGVVDLKNSNVKFIGDPQKRIEEDYLRIIRFIRFKIMYDTKVETTTNSAIKLNLNGIKKISKERILVELYKILDLKNFTAINESTDLKEIFMLIFPEFENLERLDRLSKICEYSQTNRSLILATLLIDDKNSHEYFGHKYNISNNIKDNLNLFAKNLKLIKDNKDFFNKDLEKNIYLYNKDHLVRLNILNFVINSNFKLKDFSGILKRILKSKIPKFTIDGKYLMKYGMQQGLLMGKVLKKVEENWIKNNFKISKDQIKEIIQLHSN